MEKTTIERVRSKIDRCHIGTLFFVNSFPEFDGEYVRKILVRLADENVLVRIGQGVYVKPMRSKFGVVYPSVFEIAKGIAKRDNAQVMATGNTALNQLGLSTQIPMNAEFITTGSGRELQVGDRTITFRHSAPKNFVYKTPMIATMVQALRELGEENVGEDVRERLRELLSKHLNDSTLNDIQLMPVWMRKILLELYKEVSK